MSSAIGSGWPAWPRGCAPDSRSSTGLYMFDFFDFFVWTISHWLRYHFDPHYLAPFPPAPSPQCRIAWSTSRCPICRADWRTFGFAVFKNLGFRTPQRPASPGRQPPTPRRRRAFAISLPGSSPIYSGPLGSKAGMPWRTSDGWGRWATRCCR